ncbi:MAG: DUF1849 family protein [Alphaproteobacteria bacterium]|nr:DUF1849 family protein [Alphaproteobacteria bacterium]
MAFAKSVGPVLLAAILVAPPAFAGAMVPHRASYDIRLKEAKWGAGVTGVTGRLVIEFNDACDGYTLNQRFVTQMQDSDGAVTTSDLWLTSWEAADGRSFRFNLKNEVDGTVVESFKGRAVIDASGGQVAYEGVALDEVTLPSGTVFPTEHAFDLIKAAEAGENALSRTVFDGSGEGDVYAAHAVIGAPRTGADGLKGLEGVPGAEHLAGLTAWPVTLSYFKTQSQAPLPDYESSFVMYSNGMSSGLVLDYGDFSLSGTLKEIEVLPDPKC